MNSTLRLLWALPLVLAVGTAAIFVLRRFVVPAPPARGAQQRLIARDSLVLSDETRVHLVEVDGVSCLIVESAQNTVQTLTMQPSPAREPLAPSRPAWLRRWSAIRQ